jgi:hypothetical protein
VGGGNTPPAPSLSPSSAVSPNHPFLPPLPANPPLLLPLPTPLPTLLPLPISPSLPIPPPPPPAGEGHPSFPFDATLPTMVSLCRSRRPFLPSLHRRSAPFATVGGLRTLALNHVLTYPTPANLSYFWSFGSLSALCLGLQFLSGIFLAMHYSASAEGAFASLEHIMRDVQGGWFLRYLHANGASAFFGVVYLHLLRGLLYRSFSYGNRTVWLSGVVIFILMMATAFIGYVLPWGQMSLWGATVITNRAPFHHECRCPTPPCGGGSGGAVSASNLWGRKATGYPARANRVGGSQHADGGGKKPSLRLGARRARLTNLFSTHIRASMSPGDRNPPPEGGGR